MKRKKLIRFAKGLKRKKKKHLLVSLQPFTARIITQGEEMYVMDFKYPSIKRNWYIDKINKRGTGINK